MANSRIPPIINAGFLYMNGFTITNDATTPNTLLDVGVGQCRDSTNTYDIILNSSLTINAALNGLNGLDSGTFTASKLYYIFIIFDPLNENNTGCLLSLSPTAPLLPFGYGAFRIIGFAASDSSTHILKMYISGDNVNRTLFYDAPQATAVTAGAATSYTAIDLSALVPTFDNIPVWIYSDFTPGAASRQLFMQPQGAIGDAIKITGQVTSVHVTSNSLVLAKLATGKPEIAYKVSNAGDAAAINVTGFQYYV